MLLDVRYLCTLILKKIQLHVCFLLLFKLQPVNNCSYMILGHSVILCWKGWIRIIESTPGSTWDHPKSNPMSEGNIQTLLELWHLGLCPGQPVPCPLPSSEDPFPNPTWPYPGTAPCRSLRPQVTVTREQSSVLLSTAPLLPSVRSCSHPLSFSALGQTN